MDITKQIEENNGWLKMRCIALDRMVFIFGEQLRPEESQKVYNHSPNGFNWGYNGSGASQLALAVLLEIMPRDEARKHYMDFRRAVVSQLPAEGVYDVMIDVGTFMKSVNGKLTEPIHAYQLLHIHIGDGCYISKFLDFPNLPYKSAILDNGSVEYLELIAMGEDNLILLQNYIQSKTKRKKVNEDRLEWATLEKEGEFSFIYRNGMGSLDHKGTKSFQHS